MCVNGCEISGFRCRVNEIFAFLECSVDWQLVTEISEQHIGTIFKGEGTNRFSRNFDYYQSIYNY
jgi:hypothetical protein